MCHRKSLDSLASHLGLGLVLLLLALLPGLVSANALTALDPRSMSLGGAGAASMRPYNASFFNPARYAGNPQVSGRHDDRAFARGFVGVRLIDRDGFLDSVNQYQENDNSSLLDERIDHLEDRIRDLEVEREDFRAVTEAGNALLDDLEGLSDKPLRLAASTGINAGWPGEQWGVGAHVRQNLVLGMEVRVSESDRRAVREMLDFVDLLVEVSETGVVPPDTTLPEVSEELTSDFAMQGALVRDSAVSFASRVSGWEGVTVGLTVKSLYVESLDWRIDVGQADSDNFELDEQRRAHSDPNLDLGIIQELDENWSAALMVRNLISRDYETVLGNEIAIRPIARVGLGWQTETLSFALDMDLNEAAAIGFDPAKQYVSLGAEYRPWAWMALRAGYRYEAVLREGNVSGGIGFTGRRGHFDLALSGDTGDSVGIAMQAGVRF